MAGDRASDDDFRLALLGLAAFGALVGFGWWKRSGAAWYETWSVVGWEQLRPWLVLGAVVGAVLAVLGLLVGIVGWRRKMERERYEQEIRSLLRAKDGKRNLVRLSGRRGDRRITVRYPPGWRPDDSMKRRVTQRLERAYGQTLDGAWGMRRVVFTTAPPEPTEAEEVERDQTPDERVSAVLTGALGPVIRQVTPTWSGDDLIQVVATFEPGTAPTPARRRSAERNVSAALPGGHRWRADWQDNRDRVVFSQREELPTLVPHPGPKAAVGRTGAGYGIAEGGGQQVWDPNVTPHVLAAGKTGTGKTRLLEALVVSLLWLPDQPEIVGCDPKRIEMTRMRRWPGVTRVATELDDIVTLIGLVHAEMKRRYELIEAADEAGEPRPELRRVVLIVDEFVELNQTLRARDGIKGNGSHPAIEQCDSIARLGRSAGVHLLIAAQRPDVTYIPGAMRDNIDHRISLGELNEQGARMMWNAAGVGTQVGRDAYGKPYKGRATAQGPNGPREIQVYAVPDDPAWCDLPPVDGLPSFLADAPRPSIRPGRSASRVPSVDPDLIEAHLNARVTVVDQARVADLAEGDWIKLDVGNGDIRTVTVEAIEPDGDDHYEVEWNDRDDQAGVLSLDGDELVDRV